MARRGENIYKRKDGRYEGRFIQGYRPGHKPIWGYVYGRQYYDVRKRLSQKKAENDRPPVEIGRVGSGSFGDWFNYWLDYSVRPKVKSSTYECYRTLADNHVLPCYGKLQLGKITSCDTRLMPAEMQKAGLSSSTCKSAYRLFKASVEAALEEHLIAENPIGKNLFRKEKGHKARVLTVYEQEMVTRKAMEAREFSVLISLYTGLRIGEVCALRWDDINWNERTLNVHATVQRVRVYQDSATTKTELAVSVPKTEESQRTIPMPAFIIRQLRVLYAQNPANGYILGDKAKPADPRVMQKRCAKMTKSLGLIGVHFHTFRHSYATRLLEMGVDIKTVSALLGHSSVQTTLNCYAHSTPEHQRQAVLKLERFAI